MKRFLLMAVLSLAALPVAARAASQDAPPPSRPMVGGGVQNPWRNPWSLAMIDPASLPSTLLVTAAAATLLRSWRRR